MLSVKYDREARTWIGPLPAFQGAYKHVPIVLRICSTYVNLPDLNQIRVTDVI